VADDEKKTEKTCPQEEIEAGNSTKMGQAIPEGNMKQAEGLKLKCQSGNYGTFDTRAGANGNTKIQ
jgi:hypothetical protein